jgi:hypothetical protein
VTPIERSESKPSACAPGGGVTTGIFATLRASLRAKGTGAPAAGPIAILVLALVGLFAFAVAPAFAASPTFTVDPTPTVGYTTAQVSGTVNPENHEVFYWFEYSQDPEIEGWIPGPEAFTRTLAAGSGSANVSETLTGLKPGTEYEVRLHAFATSFSGEEWASGEPYVSFTTKPVAKPTVTIAAVSTFTSTTAHFSGTVDPNAPGAAPGQDPAFNTSWHFQCTPECPGLAGGEIEGDNTAHEVTAEASGLRPNVDYKVELVASNVGGETTAGPQTFHTPAVKPTINSLKSSGETTTTANLQAQVNPGGEEAGYVIEYGPSTSYGSSVSGSIPAGSAEVPVERELTGLEANKEYHWRLLVKNLTGSATSVDHTFVYSTGASGLPDGRQYEMVTPPEKNGALVGGKFGGFETEIAEDGARVYATTVQCLPGAESCVIFEHGRGVSLPVGFTRGSSGWVSEALTLPAGEVQNPTVMAANPSAGTALFEVPVGGAERDWYGRTENGKVFQIGPFGESEVKETQLVQPEELATANLTHLVYVTDGPAWRFDPSKQPPGFALPKGLYEYEGAGNSSPRLVALAPESDEIVDRCGSTLGGQLVKQGALSEDGETVYFSVEHCPAEDNGGHEVRTNRVYVRYEHARSELVSAPATSGEPPVGGETCDAVCQSEPQGAARFDGASSDGSRVFFTDPHKLTDRASEDSEEPAANENFTEAKCYEPPAGLTGCNLYESECPNRCKNPSERRLVAVSAGDTSGEGPRVLGVAALSADGSHVYFVAEGDLTGANNEGHAPVAGQPNLYMYEHDANFPDGRLAFVATLLPGEIGGDQNVWYDNGGDPEQANVTPDGRFLVFKSHVALTPDDTRPVGPTQVYRYDAETGTLMRVSIGVKGFADDGNEGAVEATIVEAGSGLGRKIEPLRTDPTMSNDGNFVFFKSPNGLTPHALNDVPAGKDGKYAWNVYEWEAPGTQVNGSVSCTEPQGCVFLISDGRDVAESGGGHPSVELLGSDGSGANVFFTTSDQLVSQDTDTERDFYDAHICSASEPCAPPAAEALPPCLGEACHGIPAEQLGAPTGGSLTLNGLGNITGGRAPNPPAKKVTKKKTVKCKKGFTKKKNKCVKNKKSKRAKKAGHGGRTKS